MFLLITEDSRSYQRAWSSLGASTMDAPRSSGRRRDPTSSCLGPAGLAWAGEGQWAIVNSREEARP